MQGKTEKCASLQDSGKRENGTDCGSPGTGLPSRTRSLFHTTDAMHCLAQEGRAGQDLGRVREPNSGTRPATISAIAGRGAGMQGRTFVVIM